MTVTLGSDRLCLPLASGEGEGAREGHYQFQKTSFRRLLCLGDSRWKVARVSVLRQVVTVATGDGAGTDSRLAGPVPAVVVVPVAGHEGVGASVGATSIVWEARWWAQRIPVAVTESEVVSGAGDSNLRAEGVGDAGSDGRAPPRSSHCRVPY